MNTNVISKWLKEALWESDLDSSTSDKDLSLPSIYVLTNTGGWPSKTIPHNTTALLCLGVTKELS